MESNHYFRFRKPTFYPLNYKAAQIKKPHEAAFKRLLSVFDNDLTASVIATLRADTVIDHSRAAVRAGGEGRDRREIVRTALVTTLLGKFVFRMCHCFIF